MGFATGTDREFAQPHFRHVKECLYGSLCELLKVKKTTMVDSQMFATLFSRVGIDAAQARSAFVMLDVEHKGVLIFDAVLKALQACPRGERSPRCRRPTR